MPRNKHIRGRDAVRVADELAHREPVKLLSAAGEKGKQVMGLSPQRSILPWVIGCYGAPRTWAMSWRSSHSPGRLKYTRSRHRIAAVADAGRWPCRAPRHDASVTIIF